MSLPTVVVVGSNKRLLTSIRRSGRYRVALVEEPDVIESKDVRQTVHDVGGEVELIPAAYQQSDEILTSARVRSLQPVAVVPGQEYAVPASARLAEQTGLLGAGSHAADILTDKLRLREVTTAAGMPGPAYQQVESAEDVQNFLRHHGEAVLKPANRQGSVGVELLDRGDDVDGAWTRCTGASDPGQLAQRTMRWRYLVEERLTGQEVSVESLVRAGRTAFTNVTAKHLVPGRYPVEAGHDVPAALPDELSRLLRAQQQELVTAVDFRDGILHSEWKIDGPPRMKASLIECAGRTPGDSIIPLIQHAYGFDPYITLVDLLAGRNVQPPRRAGGGASIRFLSAVPGRFLRVDGTEVAEAGAGSPVVTVLAQRGDIFGSVRTSWDRVAQVVCVGPDTGTAACHADNALARLGIVAQVTTAPGMGR